MLQLHEIDRFYLYLRVLIQSFGDDPCTLLAYEQTDRSLIAVVQEIFSIMKYFVLEIILSKLIFNSPSEDMVTFSVLSVILSMVSCDSVHVYYIHRNS
jgi:hypothetical protein